MHSLHSCPFTILSSQDSEVVQLSIIINSHDFKATEHRQKSTGRSYMDRCTSCFTVLLVSLVAKEDEQAVSAVPGAVQSLVLGRHKRNCNGIWCMGDRQMRYGEIVIL